MANNKLPIREIDRIISLKTKDKVKCKCGHSLLIADKRGIIECFHCHNLVFKDKKTEFEYRIKANLIKEKRNSK